MEYTKDISLNRVCKRQIRYTKLKSWTSFMKEKIIENRFVFGVLSLLSILIMVDLLLVNSFLQLLSNLY